MGFAGRSPCVKIWGCWGARVYLHVCWSVVFFAFGSWDGVGLSWLDDDFTLKNTSCPTYIPIIHCVFVVWRLELRYGRERNAALKIFHLHHASQL